MGCKWSSPTEGRRSQDAETHSPGKPKSNQATYAAAFLDKLGLTQYTAAFEKSGFENPCAICNLCQQDLDDIEKFSGYQILPGHRKVLVHAASRLQGTKSTDTSKSAGGPGISLDAVGLDALDMSPEANHQPASSDSEPNQPQHQPPYVPEQQPPQQPQQPMQQPLQQHASTETRRPSSGSSSGKENAQAAPVPSREVSSSAVLPSKGQARDSGGHHQKRRSKQAVSCSQKMPALSEVEQAGHQPPAALPAGQPMQAQANSCNHNGFEFLRDRPLARSNDDVMSIKSVSSSTPSLYRTAASRGLSAELDEPLSPKHATPPPEQLLLTLTALNQGWSDDNPISRLSPNQYLDPHRGSTLSAPCELPASWGAVKEEHSPVKGGFRAASQLPQANCHTTGEAGYLTNPKDGDDQYLTARQHPAEDQDDIWSHLADSGSPKGFHDTALAAGLRAPKPSARDVHLGGLLATNGIPEGFLGHGQLNVAAAVQDGSLQALDPRLVHLERHSRDIDSAQQQFPLSNGDPASHSSPFHQGPIPLGSEPPVACMSSFDAPPPSDGKQAVSQPTAGDVPARPRPPEPHPYDQDLVSIVHARIRAASSSVPKDPAAVSTQAGPAEQQPQPLGGTRRSDARPSSGGTTREQKRGATNHAPLQQNGLTAGLSFVLPAEGPSDRDIAMAAASEGFSAADPTAAADPGHPHTPPPAAAAHTPFGFTAGKAPLTRGSSQEPATSISYPPASEPTVGRHSPNRGSSPEPAAPNAVPTSRAASIGQDGRDPHPTALRVVQEIKRMRSRAASGAETMVPDAEAEAAQAGGQPPAAFEHVQLGTQEGRKSASGAASIRFGRISGRAPSGKAACELVGELPDLPHTAHETPKAAWVIPW
ncbi:hypothetical protein WJX74_002653 [Apatococcus lobatus]|uniref:SAM domain-containing protein n=1 Tax=Apatococcus lobatus TaxID=904363 RepID=A0AAW1QYK6_9CHLO